MPKEIYSGETALDQISTIVSNVKRIAVFTDKGVMGAGLLDTPLTLLKKAGKEVIIFDDLPTEPSCDEAQSVVDRFKAEKVDFIMAVGGGSVMDIAKLASVLATDDYGVRELLETPGITRKNTRTLMIPTTAGTGAEATPNSIVTVPEKELKVGIVNTEMIADYVILDGRMIQNLPLKIAASTGVDALAHAIECFTSKKATPFSDVFALEALDLIINNIEKACTDTEALEAKNAMLLASFYAGVAITASGTTAVHALSYPLGGKYHIPHGVSNAMMLIPVMKFNEPMCKSQFARAYDRVNKHPEMIEESEKSAWMIQRMDEIVKHLEIPTSLSAYGIGTNDLDGLVQAGMDVQRLLVNNMREVTENDARRLYLEII